MINKLLFLLAICSFTASCQSTPKDTTKETGQAQSFGELITADGAIPYHEMIANLATTDSMKVKVKGTVQAVCQAKGCWININDSQANTETFVKFKDYGFFMPKDCSGREVIMEGYAYREVTSVDELRHYAEDEGKTKEEIEAITEPVEEMKFMASGVLLLPEEGKQ
ncbi:MAG: DUF4920 domain-containing protein [Saprospiraceae bacterium]|jgi:hypothetical protein